MDQVNGRDERDPRIVCGVNCTWWGSIYEVGYKESDLPCCPVCSSPLYEFPNEQIWRLWTRQRRGPIQKSVKQFRLMIYWGRERCYPNLRALQFAYDNRMRGDLEVRCRRNWNRIPEDKRRACIDYLRSAMPDEVVLRFREQHARGEKIGADIPGFHFYGGMNVRNILRQVVKDDELPGVEYPDGTLAQNWDDFYTGALEELCERELAH